MKWGAFRLIVTCGLKLTIVTSHGRSSKLSLSGKGGVAVRMLLVCGAARKACHGGKSLTVLEPDPTKRYSDGMSGWPSASSAIRVRERSATVFRRHGRTMAHSTSLTLPGIRNLYDATPHRGTRH